MDRRISVVVRYREYKNRAQDPETWGLPPAGESGSLLAEFAGGTGTGAGAADRNRKNRPPKSIIDNRSQQQWTFDRVYAPTTQTVEIFNDSAKDIVLAIANIKSKKTMLGKFVFKQKSPSTKSLCQQKSLNKFQVHACFEGINGTIFAYGQTASGKTYTMHGDQRQHGIIPYSILEMFRVMDEHPDWEYLLSVSYLEIYNENIIGNFI